MIAGDALLDVFINANILFLLCFALWSLVRLAMAGLGLKHAYDLQLRLLNSLFIMILCAPIVVMGFAALQDMGIGRGVNVNLSDAVVAYYLNGGIPMKSSQFEAIVLMRDNFVLSVTNGEGLFARAVIALFLAGLALGFFRLLMSIVCLWRIVTQAYAWRRIGRIKLRLSDRTLVPFSTRGLRYFYVVIPSHMLGKSDEMKVAIAHELQHIRQGDLAWEIYLEALKPIFFFNPAYRAWKRQVEHLRELNCDAQVLRSGRINTRTYCETLLSVCQKTLRRDRSFVLAVPKVTLVTADRHSFFRRKRSFLEHRIDSALETGRSRRSHWVSVCIGVPLLALTVLTTLAIQSPGDWSHDRLMLSTVVNLDRLDEINRLTTFGRARN